ncbi:MAG TPA: bifunctional riboflavin kinase/FAD synthetase [Actinomycetota bacterium]|nr:bifunctional riboflavin kinase/FAD synthetase [Actinomycetota bacterium]
MEVVQGSRSLPIHGESSVTIGVFDGVHAGHRAVIGRAVEVARERDLRAVAVTFDRHPLETLSPGKTPKLLTTPRRKAELIDALGVDVLFVLEFTEEVSRWSPEDFVERVLVRGLRARHVAVGASFTFGHRAAGTVATLAELGTRHGFTAEGLETVLVGSRRVSSSSIRDALSAGDLEWSEVALGRRYAVEGTVVPGAGRGRELGFPTANLRTPEAILLPGRGVYAGRATAGETSWPAAINVGVNPTFGREPLHLEAYLLGFEGDLTGTVVGIEFWARLRDEVAFDGPAQLSRQIGLDVEATRRLVPGGRERPVIP